MKIKKNAEKVKRGGKCPRDPCHVSSLSFLSFSQGNNIAIQE